jgi:hypothetical protein
MFLQLLALRFSKWAFCLMFLCLKLLFFLLLLLLFLGLLTSSLALLLGQHYLSIVGISGCDWFSHVDILLELRGR